MTAPIAAAVCVAFTDDQRAPQCAKSGNRQAVFETDMAAQIC
jgi:hypothetical protein